LPEQYLAPPVSADKPQPLKTDADVGLSAREVDIMEWVRKGKTNQEIGMILDISAFTVKNHVQRIFKKLDVVNRAQAVAKIETMRNGSA
jgi:DNA-binding CsgD family transcriptional regulator